MTREILLCSTLNDPRGVFLDHIRSVGEKVLESYRGWVINVTQVTDDKVKSEIQRLKGINIYLTEADTTTPLVRDKVENDHLYVLSKAAETARKLGVRRVQYTDGDRIIVAAKYFPQDLHQASEEAAHLVGDSMNFLNLRRSPEDYFTHHPPLVETELEFNRLYSRVFGIPLDVSSTAHVMPLDVVEEIIRRSPNMESVSFPQPKWLIIARQMGATISSVETHHILTFETPEQYREEMGKQGVDRDYTSLQRDYMLTRGLSSTLSSNEWKARFGTERQYLKLLLNHIESIVLNDLEKQKLTNEIQQSLTSLEGRQNAILEVLEQSSKKPEQ